jgi:hypothetical protein
MNEEHYAHKLKEAKEYLARKEVDLDEVVFFREADIEDLSKEELIKLLHLVTGREDPNLRKREW